MGKRASGAEQPHKLPADIASWYLDALESAPFGVLIHDGSGKVLYYNRFLEKLTGYSRTEIPDIRTWIEKVYPDPSYRKVVNAERAAQWPAEELRIRESIITIKDGTKRPCLFSSNTSASGVHTVTIQPAEGEWEALAGAIAGYENFQSQFYSTPTPLMAWIRQKKGFVLAAYNKAVETITSGKIRGSVGKSARELLNAPAAVLDCMRKCYDGKNSVECPKRFELPGVDTGYDYDRTFLFMPPKYVVMHISTASEFERTRKSLRESERRYRELVDMLPITIFEVDTDGNYTFLNRQGLKLLGCGPDELKHIKSLEMIVEADRDRARENFARVFSGRGTGPISYTARVADGRVIPITLQTTNIVKDGSVIGLRGYVIDESERRKAEKDLEKAYAEMERMVAERTRALEEKTGELLEVNTALRVLLRTQHAHKEEVTETVHANAIQLVLPHLAKLQKSQLSKKQHSWLRQAVANLENISSPLGGTISNNFAKLTPSEFQVADLIKNGKTTKEIADILDTAVRTVETHRKNIRRKLGIRHQKVNLRTYLLSL